MYVTVKNLTPHPIRLFFSPEYGLSWLCMTPNTVVSGSPESRSIGGEGGRQ